MEQQTGRIPGTINRIVPLEIVQVEYVNGEFKDEKAIMVIEAGFIDQDSNSPELKNMIRVIDIYRNPPGEWRQTGKVTKWLVQAIQKHMKDTLTQSDVEGENNEREMADI